jgi:hypothetical protein
MNGVPRTAGVKCRTVDGQRGFIDVLSNTLSSTSLIDCLEYLPSICRRFLSFSENLDQNKVLQKLDCQLSFAFSINDLMRNGRQRNLHLIFWTMTSTELCKTLSLISFVF